MDFIHCPCKWNHCLCINWKVNGIRSEYPCLPPINAAGIPCCSYSDIICGLREIGAVWLFGLVGIAPEKAMSMSIIFGLMLIIGGLPGIALLLRNNRRHSNVLN